MAAAKERSWLISLEIFERLCEEIESEDGKLPMAAIMNWLQQSGITGVETGITEFDVKEAHAKNAEDEKMMSAEELKNCIENLAQKKGIETKELMDTLGSSGPPEMDAVKIVADRAFSKSKK